MEFYDNTEEETNPFIEPVETILNYTDKLNKILENKGYKHQINTELLFDDIRLNTKVKITIDY